MLKEYALDPELLATWKDFRFFIGHFGAGQGRLISRFPKNWKRMVYEAAQSAKDVEYLKIEDALRRIDGMLLRREHQYDNGHDWVRNAVEENQSHPFHSIISTKNYDNCANLLVGDDIDPSDPPALWIVPMSVLVERIAAQMAECVSALLTQCDEALFIDPYFGPGKRRYTDPLKLFLQAIASRGTRRMPSRIEYHAGNQDLDTAKYQNDLEQWVKPHLPAGVTLSVIRWIKDQMHNRYILTDRGGVMFGQGLDDGRNGNIQHDTVSLLDNDTCAELMINYSRTSQRLTWMNDIYSVTGA